MTFTAFSTTPGLPDDNAVIEQLALFDCVAYNRMDLLNTLKLDVGDFIQLAWHWDPNSYPPVWAMFSQGMNLYVHVGGTNQPVGGNIQNVMGAVNAVPFLPSGTISNSVWISFAATLGAAMRPFLPSPSTGWTVNYVGHSHGAAISYLIACLFSSSFGFATWNWFGIASPRIFAGPRVTSPWLPQFGAVIVNEGDAVCLVPPAGALGTINGPSLASGILTGNVLSWYHPVDRWTYTPTGTRTRTILTSNDPPLTPGLLANLGNTHPISCYNTTLNAYYGVING